jgi:hypothetical protein
MRTTVQEIQRSSAANTSAGPCAVDLPGTYPVESAVNLLRLSPEERKAGTIGFFGEGFANADDNGPSYRDGHNGPYDGKQKECSNKRA